MHAVLSLAIETSCRRGGVALGSGDEMLREIAFDASARHASALVGRMRDLLRDHGARVHAVGELYVSAGPGSFTGTRIGVTVARTLGQALPNLRCVAVPSPLAVATASWGQPWTRLAVALDAREDMLHVWRFERGPDGPVALDRGQLLVPEELAGALDPQTTLAGEALHYHDLSSPGHTVLDESLWLPSAAGVWRAGRRLARAGEFTDCRRLLPIYARAPEALRLWESRHGKG
jgi:tRNA threonylcarbamoyl adenosine modification protein YeaZ